MIEFPPYNPYEHAVSTSDNIEEVSEQLKQTSKAIDRAELRELVCDMLLSREKPTPEVINKYADRIEEIYERGKVSKDN